MGPYWQTVSSPIATPLPPRCRTSRVSARLVNQLPVFEISWPTKNRRKLRWRNDANVPVKLTTGPPAWLSGRSRAPTRGAGRREVAVGQAVQEIDGLDELRLLVGRDH